MSTESEYLVATDDVAWVLVRGHVEKWNEMQRVGVDVVGCKKRC